MTEPAATTFALETYARRSVNYLTRMVDQNGQPYFNVFWTEPAVAAHDWPDFTDVTSRQLQASIMVRHMTGTELPIEGLWYQRLLSYRNPSDGLFYRPKTSYCERAADLADQALTLYALVTAFVDYQDRSLREIIFEMVDGLWKKWEEGAFDRKEYVSASGFILKSLVTCARSLDNDRALRLAHRIVQKIFYDGSLFPPDGKIRRGAHMHSTLRTLLGAADYALTTGDEEVYQKVRTLFEHARSLGTGFGFVPEVVERQGDVISCETCAMMDYLGLAATFASHGNPEYWDIVERTARNHLIESQVVDGYWLVSDPNRPDTEQFTWRDIGARMIGGFAGWSSPNHLLAAKETLNAHWGGAELRDKARAFQNCCGGSGIHALYIAWKNIASFEKNRLTVNLHVDKQLPQAEIRCYQPYEGLLVIKLTKDCSVRVRIPSFLSPEQIKVESPSGIHATKVGENYLDLGEHRAGEILQLSYLLPEFEEEIQVGNPGFKQYRYRVRWRGDTVMKLEPIGNEWETGYSEFDKREVQIYYGLDGPGKLYRREFLAKPQQPQPALLHMDTGDPDF